MVAPAAERGQMTVADALSRKSLGKGVPIELRRRPRARDRSHVDDQIDVRLPKQRDELGDRPRRMTDREYCRARRRSADRDLGPDGWSDPITLSAHDAHLR